MLVRVPALLSALEVAQCRDALAHSQWVDGKVTAGAQSAQAKHNLQISETSKEARELGELILQRLGRNEVFTSAALPLRVFPPLFNRYDAGMKFDTHIDNSIRFVPGAPIRVRTDLSATLFLTAPEDYDGDIVGDLNRLRMSAGSGSSGAFSSGVEPRVGEHHRSQRIEPAHSSSTCGAQPVHSP